MILPNITGVPSFNTPTCAVSFSTLSEDQRAVIQGFGMIEDPKTPRTFRGSPSAKNVVNLLRMDPSERNYIPGGIPLNGMLAYHACLKAMQVFQFMSHYYDQTSSTNLFTKDDINSADRSFSADQLHHFLVAGGRGTVQANLSEALSTEAQTTTQIIASSAFPVVLPITAIFGFHDMHLKLDAALEGIPSGAVFPYFKHMVEPDKIMTATVFQRLFFRCLAGTIENCGRAWGRIRVGLRSLALTDAGQALSHAFLGISFAENSQSGIRFIIDNGVYHGFVLSGTFNAIINGVVYHSVPTDTLISEFKKLDKSNKAKADLIALIRLKMNTESEVRYNFTIDDLSTSRRTLRTLQALDFELFTPDENTLITKLANEISFGDRYLEVNKTNLLIAFDHILTGEDTALTPHPAFIQDGYFRTNTRVSNALGIFGPLAPLFNFGSKNDKEITFPSATAREDNNMLQVDGKRSLPFLPYKLVPLRHAVQLTEQFLSSGKLFIPQGKSQKPSAKGKEKLVKEEFSDATKRDGLITGNELVELYQKMKACVNLKRAMGEGRKRKLGNENSGERGIKKAKTGNVEDASLF